MAMKNFGDNQPIIITVKTAKNCQIMGFFAVVKLVIQAITDFCKNFILQGFIHIEHARYLKRQANVF